MTVSPAAVTALLGATQTFTVTVSNATNTAVTWSVNGIPGGNSAVGTVAAQGQYTAPATLPTPPVLTLTAASVADPTKSASAQITVASDIAVSLAPSSSDVELGAARTFTASVSSAGNPDRSLRWSLSAPGCAGSACGTIDSAGRYTAPQILPSPAAATLTATSVADPSKQSSAAIRITSSFSLALTGPSSLSTGAAARFSAVLTPALDSSPNPSITWQLSGAGCTGSACGSLTVAASTIPTPGAIQSDVTYTAPGVAPNPPSVTLRAVPSADPSKAAAMNISLLAPLGISVLPASASVALGATQLFTASVTGTANTGVIWEVNGVPGGDAAHGTILSPANDPSHATYAAPPTMPASPQITIGARSAADPGVSAVSAVTLFSNISVVVSPASATRAANHRQTLSVQVAGASNNAVAWSVNGVPGGNTSVGQICAAGSVPCQPVLTSSAAAVDYLAPGAIPQPNPVTVTAASLSDPSRTGSAQITVLSHILVSVSPPSVILAPRAAQAFTAAVLGTDNQSVIWQVQGAACASSCGTIDSTGLYAAPLSAPSPNSFQVVATSSEDTQQSGSASVTISTGPAIFTLLPDSLLAGAAGGFTLKAQGGNFVPSSPGPGSMLVIAGGARTTTCPSAAECSAAVSAADVAAPGNLPVQVRNPDGSSSNQVSLVVVAPAVSDDAIALTTASPAAAGKDIVVVEPSTAGVSQPGASLDLDVAALGPFSISANSCSLAGNPVVLTAPASGSVTADICVFSSSGLDAGMNYSVSGSGDVSVIARQPAGLGIIHLTLQIAAGAAPGPRALFIENSNKDKTAATGALEVRWP